MIDVDIDGKPFQEMHVDGGVITQVFEFDTAYMRHLFDYSFQLSKKGYPWHEAVPTESLPMNVQMNAFNSPH
jgi:hypothetical protein